MFVQLTFAAASHTEQQPQKRTAKKKLQCLFFTGTSDLRFFCNTDSYCFVNSVLFCVHLHYNISMHSPLVDFIDYGFMQYF